MIDVTSLPESTYIFILRAQVILIVFFILRLGRFALNIIRKDEKRVQRILDSLFQLDFPLIFLFAGLFQYKRVSYPLMCVIIMNMLLRPLFPLNKDNFKVQDKIFVGICYSVLTVLGIGTLAGII